MAALQLNLSLSLCDDAEAAVGLFYIHSKGVL